MRMGTACGRLPVVGQFSSGNQSPHPKKKAQKSTKQPACFLEQNCRDEVQIAKWQWWEQEGLPKV